MNGAYDPNFEPHHPSQLGGAAKGSNNQTQARRLMETSNMFSVYRNSLKNNINNISNGYEANSNGGSTYASVQQTQSEPVSKQGSHAP